MGLISVGDVPDRSRHFSNSCSNDACPEGSTLDDHDLREFNGVCRLFPLPGVVIFPHNVVPLHIFEPRYIQMTEDSLATDRLVAIVQLAHPPQFRDDGNPEVEEVACLGRILNYDRLPDGRYNYLLLGRKRIRIRRELPGPKLYRSAEVDILEDVYPDEPDPAAQAELTRLFRAALQRQMGEVDPDLSRMLESDISLGVLSDIIAHALNLPSPMKQAFLVNVHVTRRADALLKILRQTLEDPSPTGPRSFPPDFSSN